MDLEDNDVYLTPTSTLRRRTSSTVHAYSEYLAVNLDQKLTFNQHIPQVTKNFLTLKSLVLCRRSLLGVRVKLLLNTTFMCWS